LSRVLGPALFGAILLAWAAHGHAQVWPAADGGAIVRHALTGGFVEVGGPFSTWPAANDGAGGVVLKGTQAVKLPSAKLELQLSKALTVGGLARGVAFAARMAGPIALVGLAYEGVRWFDNQWMKAGDSQSLPGVIWSAGNDGNPFPTAKAACLDRGAAQSPSNGSYGVYLGDGTTLPPGTMSENWWLWMPQPECQVWVPTGGNPSLLQTLYMQARYTACPAGETRDPATGRCGTAAEVPATDDDLIISFQQGLIANPGKAADVAKSVFDSGVKPSQLALGDTVVSGPASVQGPQQTTTTMTDAGTRTDQRSTVYNVTYNSSTVNITETTTTTTTNPDNSVQTSTTTTTAPGSGGDQAPPPETPDVCVDHPDASGCEPLGEHDDDVELEEEQRDVDFDQELSDAGSCPAGKSLSILGKSYTLEWTPLCDLARGVRPVVIALSWLSAAAFVFMIGRGTA
jgi:hypothetical protein